jgi:hypothetical protein
VAAGGGGQKRVAKLDLTNMFASKRNKRKQSEGKYEKGRSGSKCIPTDVFISLPRYFKIRVAFSRQVDVVNSFEKALK